MSFRRRKSDTSFIGRNFMGIITIVALIIMVFMSEIVGMLESVK
jgi:hypothetical protein